jgi:Ca-activated chloride channel homolog
MSKRIWVLGGIAAGIAFLGCGSAEHKGRDQAVNYESDGGGGDVYLPQAPEPMPMPTQMPMGDRMIATADEEAPPVDPHGREEYTDYGVRPFVEASQDNLSTFSIDVDTGSYTVTRRKLREGYLPPVAAVRVEEFVNYFRQDYPNPEQGPFAVVSEAAPSPFRPGRVLLRVGLQGRRVDHASRRRANLVFLVDTSGSMSSADKLGLLKESLSVLVRNLREDDRVAICTYAGSVSMVLPPTPASEQRRILAALAGLRSGGSTAMGSGIELAYRLAAQEAGSGVSSRVIVCSDGDANVGPTSHDQILELIEDHRDAGITLGTVGFGMGNYRDTLMEQLADRGDGSYAYVDSLFEANRLFGEDLVSSLETIARDTKLQVEFDPERVARYRLIGYENRAILDEDFRDDDVDAGEVGAGHTVTALYELELVAGGAGRLGQVRLRYEDPELSGRPATEELHALTGQVAGSFEGASQRFRFVACAAEFAEVLRDSPHVDTQLSTLIRLVERTMSPSYDDREQDFLDMVRRAAVIAGLRG